MVVRTSFVLFAASALAVAKPCDGGGNPSITITIPPLPTETEPASQCDTGALLCCDEVESASDSDVTALLALLGIVLEDLDVLVGLTCSPIDVIGTGASDCSAEPVCCENNDFNGLIALGCVPVDLF